MPLELCTVSVAEDSDQKLLYGAGVTLLLKSRQVILYTILVHEYVARY